MDKEALVALGIDAKDWGMLTTLENLVMSLDIQSGCRNGTRPGRCSWHRRGWVLASANMAGTASCTRRNPLFSDVLKPQLFSHPHNLFLETLAELVSSVLFSCCRYWLDGSCNSGSIGWIRSTGLWRHG